MEGLREMNLDKMDRRLGIQGTEENIDRVILAIEAGRYVKIENMDSRMIPVESEERGFRTR